MGFPSLPGQLSVLPADPTPRRVSKQRMMTLSISVRLSERRSYRPLPPWNLRCDYRTLGTAEFSLIGVAAPGCGHTSCTSLTGRTFDRLNALECPPTPLQHLPRTTATTEASLLIRSSIWFEWKPIESPYILPSHGRTPWKQDRLCIMALRHITRIVTGVLPVGGKEYPLLLGSLKCLMASLSGLPLLVGIDLSRRYWCLGLFCGRQYIQGDCATQMDHGRFPGALKQCDWPDGKADGLISDSTLRLWDSGTLLYGSDDDAASHLTRDRVDGLRKFCRTILETNGGVSPPRPVLGQRVIPLCGFP